MWEALGREIERVSKEIANVMSWSPLVEGDEGSHRHKRCVYKIANNIDS